MKKCVLVTLITLMLFGCSSHEMKMLSMPKYKAKECYFSDGFQDYTDYCKYDYDEESIIEFIQDDRFKEVMDSDVANIIGYFANFSECVIYEDYYEKYDFDNMSQIKEGDYFYIITKENEVIEGGAYGKYDNYDVYYVDMSKCVLYYIHTNI